MYCSIRFPTSDSSFGMSTVCVYLTRYVAMYVPRLSLQLLTCHGGAIIERGAIIRIENGQILLSVTRYSSFVSLL